jgi:hypothetical protein
MIHNEHPNKEFIMDLYFKRQILDNNISFMSWWLQDKERLISEDSNYVVPTKYLSYSALVPKK